MAAVVAASQPSSVTRVLHVVGSSNDKFMFQVSWLYAKSCPKDIVGPVDQCLYDYAIVVPSLSGGVSATSEVKWFFISGCESLEEIDDNAFFSTEPDPSAIGGKPTRDSRLPALVQGPFSMGDLTSLLEAKRSESNKSNGKFYDLMVPHCFCYRGMTFFRQLFEDGMGIPHPGPKWLCNALSQNKALTRDVLSKVEGVKIPKGETLFQSGEEAEKFPEPTLELPFVVKPAEEDNSRGVSLCRVEADVRPALLKAFSYGNQVVLEEFIPGREVRAGCVVVGDGICREGLEPSHKTDGVPRVLSCKVEYLMGDYPIRREEDKLTSVQMQPTSEAASTCASTPSMASPSGSHEMKREAKVNEVGNKLVQTKCERLFLTPAGSNRLSQSTTSLIDAAVISAHRALGSRDYSLFDFRVHEETGEPYIIEACSFWTFTPISAISLMLDRSQEFFCDAPGGEGSEQPGSEPHQSGAWKRVARDMWQRTAARGSAPI